MQTFQLRRQHNKIAPHASAPCTFRECGPCYAGFAASRALPRGFALLLRQLASIA
jgi:hypothetical protein